MEVGGELGALLGADALAPLGREVAAEAPPERGEDEGEREEHDDRDDHGVLGAVERAARREHDQRRAGDQGDAEAAAVEAPDALAALRPCAGAGARRARSAGPHRWWGRRSPRPAIVRDWRHRSAAPAAARIAGQITRSRPPQPDLAQDQEHGEGEEADAGGDAGVRGQPRPAAAGSSAPSVGIAIQART